MTLVGTVAAGSIDAILTSDNQSGKPYASVFFDPTVLDPGLAFNNPLPDGSHEIRFNPDDQGEPIQALGPVLAHEALHQDGDEQTGDKDGQMEEMLNQTALAFSWAQQLLIDPSLADQKTPLVKLLNTDLLALLNSGDHSFPRIGLSNAPQVQLGSAAVPSLVFVGAIFPFTSFENFERRAAALAGVQDIDTPGNTLLDEDVSAIIGAPVSGLNFNAATRDLVDKNQHVIDNATAIKLAGILKLTLQSPPASSP